MGYDDVRFRLRPALSKNGVPAYVPLKEWLLKAGFTLPPGAISSFRYNNVPTVSTVLVKDEVQITLYSVGPSLKDVEVQFTLPRDQPPLADWQQLASSLCDEWGLAILDRETGAENDAGQFGRLLEQVWQWRDMAQARGWSTATLTGAGRAAS